VLTGSKVEMNVSEWSSLERFFRYTKKQAAVWTQLIFKAFRETRRYSPDDTDVGEKVKKD
jgi:hypothetical protein